VAKIMNWDLRTAERYIADGRELDRRLVDGTWPIAGMPPDDAVQQLEQLAAWFDAPGRMPFVKKLELGMQMLTLTFAVLRWLILREWALGSVPKAKLKSLKAVDATPALLTYSAAMRRYVTGIRRQGVKRSEIDAIVNDAIRIAVPLMMSRGWQPMPVATVVQVIQEIVRFYREMATIKPSDTLPEVDAAMGDDLRVALQMWELLTASADADHVAPKLG